MDKEKILEQIESNVSVCQKCRLYQTAKHPVPGHGNINAELVFVGEAPGKNEDDTGLPFVGRAGKLLDVLLKEIGMERKDVWIGNVIKHRPPENRQPLPDEISACEHYLTLQLEAIKPVLIVTLGRFALNYFYPDGKISRDRGNLIKLERYFVYPVYHPAAALRNPTMMRDLRSDFVRIPEVISNVKNLKDSKDQNTDPSTTDEESILDGQLGLGL